MNDARKGPWTVIMFEDLGDVHPSWVQALRKTGFEVVTTNSPSMVRQLAAGTDTVHAVVFDGGARGMRLASELAALPTPPLLVVCTTRREAPAPVPAVIAEYLAEQRLPDALIAVLRRRC